MTQPPPALGDDRAAMPFWPWFVAGGLALVFLLFLGGVGTALALQDEPKGVAAPRPVSVVPQTTPWTPPGATEEPTPPRPVGQDITISGNGNKRVEAALAPDAVYVATVTHNGDSNFVVQALDDDDQPLGLVVNAIGDYSGDRPVGLDERGQVTGFEVRARGSWKIVLRDLSKAPAFTGNASGRKPAVLLVKPGSLTGTRITATHSGRDNFVVRGWNEDDSIGLFINEIGRYQGTADLPADTAVIEVDAEAGWTLKAQ